MSESEQPEQAQIAVVLGTPVTEIPKDLYIPPEALQIFLESFEGPLDLLLYLIKRQNLDILNIPIVEITRQYIEYINLMSRTNFELAAEYLVMAAMLAEIKSRMLLPRAENNEEDEEDPRAELIRRLQEYEQFKNAAEQIDELPRLNRDTWSIQVDHSECVTQQAPPDVELDELLKVFQGVLQKAKMFTHHHIQKETLSVRERMTHVLSKLSTDNFVEFVTLFPFHEGRMGVVTTFLAILELKKAMLIDIAQNAAFAGIHVRLAGEKICKNPV
jgi:segregation and condensation protein A